MNRIALVAAILTLVLHLAGNPHYGFYRDELYFIACGWHPDWGYVDQPPLVPLLSALTQFFGHSLFLLRALPALFAAGCVYVTVLLIAEIGGAAFAQTLGALVAALDPILDAFGTKVSTDMPGLLLWPLAALLVARMLNGASPRLWIAVGLALGLAAEAKYSVAIFAVALVASLALSKHTRALLATPWFLAGIAAGAAVAAPSILWQWAHQFPILEMLANQQREVVNHQSLLGSLAQQITINNPLLAPLFVAGIAYAFFVPKLRWIGWTTVLAIGAVIALRGRDYYGADVYPLAIATGALAVEALVRPRVLRTVIVAAAALASIATLPFVLPVLPEAAVAVLVGNRTHVAHPDLDAARNTDSSITQNFSDMHGWPELAAAVADVYRALPPADRSRATILASNYGEAAAIDFFGPALGLPAAISGHNNYWIWGPRGYDGSVLVEVNGTCAQGFRRSDVTVAHFHAPWIMPSEEGIPISVCYGLREPVATLWPTLKRYI